jgi:peptidoglycan hydrolase-like protein with peptidoglycan-binding domain
MARSTTHRRGRAIATAIICLALAGGAVVAIAVRKPNATSTIEAPSIFKTATVSRGDLTTTERIDGTVQLSSTMSVLHRIEGQTSSSTTSAASAATQQPTNGAANTAALSSPLLVDDCASTTVATTTPELATSTPTADTTPATVDTTPTATTTTTTAPIEPMTTTIAPLVEPCVTTTTSTAALPEDADAGGNGAAPTGAAQSGPSGSATAAVGSTASTARVTETITSIIAANTAIQQGDVLYTVEGAPVVALDGMLPAWRSLSTASDDGADIAQLESSLNALGYNVDQKVTVDNEFDSATKAMVKAWQQGLGVEATGTVTLGSIVFLPTSTTVSAVARAVGDAVSDGDTVLTVATPTQEVLVDVPAGAEAQVLPGLAVEIGDVQGTVSRLRSANRDGSVFVVAVITPTAAIANATNGSSVKVTLTLQNDAGVLIVPSEALVSRLDGSYAVQVQQPDGVTTWLTVELIAVSGSNVAISGTDLTEGTVVLLPI